LHEKSIIAMVIVIVTDFLVFVLMHTQKNESQEYQLFGGEFWRKIGVCVYTFLYVKRHENNLPKFYNITKKYLNDSVEVWDIKFTDPYEFGIVIRQVSFLSDKQLEYINHSINNLITDENGKIQLDNEEITFNYIIVRCNSCYANQSITIFFKKKNG